MALITSLTLRLSTVDKLQKIITPSDTLHILVTKITNTGSKKLKVFIIISTLEKPILEEITLAIGIITRTHNNNGELTVKIPLKEFVGNIAKGLFDEENLTYKVIHTPIP